MQVRDAVSEDLPEITAIYNQIVLNSTAIYNDTPSTAEERTSWWKARTQAGFPVLVAEEDGRITGYASFGEFRPWPGYRFTVEGTIHIAEDARSRGLGTRLLLAMLNQAREMGKHMMIAGVDSENTASLRFLERSGFIHAGQLTDVGYKFGRFLTLHFLQYRIEQSPARNASVISGKHLK